MQDLKSHYVHLFVKDIVNQWFEFGSPELVSGEVQAFKNRLVGVDNRIREKSPRINGLFKRLTVSRLECLEVSSVEKRECKQVIFKYVDLAFPCEVQTKECSAQTDWKDHFDKGVQTDTIVSEKPLPAVASVTPMQYQDDAPDFSDSNDLGLADSNSESSLDADVHENIWAQHGQIVESTDSE